MHHQSAKRGQSYQNHLMASLTVAWALGYFDSNPDVDCQPLVDILRTTLFLLMTRNIILLLITDIMHLVVLRVLLVHTSNTLKGTEW